MAHFNRLIDQDLRRSTSNKQRQIGRVETKLILLRIEHALANLREDAPPDTRQRVQAMKKKYSNYLKTLEH